MKQTATTSNKQTAVALPIDLTYGFPGELPAANTSGDTTRLRQFFLHYATGMNARQAARKVGFSEKWAKQYSYQWLKRYADYVKWLQAHVAQVAVEELALEQSDVLRQIGAIAMANDYDYLVIDRTRTKPVVRRKRLDELTREQMAAIEVVLDPKGNPTRYRFRDRDGKLFELGKHLGMFNEKVILEHRHRHLHVSADLSKVPMARLEAIEAQYEALLTHEEPVNAQGRLPAVRGHQGKNGGAGEAAGNGKDLGGEDHQQPGRRGPSKPPKKQT